MKPNPAIQNNHAFSRADLVVTAAIFIFSAFLLVPVFVIVKRHAQSSRCRSNMVQITIAYRDWEGDHMNDYPMAVSVTNGGTMEVATGTNAWINFAVLSNELNKPQFFHCPADNEHIPPRTFNDLDGKTSYFVNLDASEKKPQVLFFGDGNFAINDIPVKSGLLNLWSNTPISWTRARHRFAGNVSFADGAVEELSSLDLHLAVTRGENGYAELGPAYQLTGVTNRIAIP